MAVSMGAWQRLRVPSTCERSRPRPSRRAAAPSMSTDHEASIVRASAATRPRPSPSRSTDVDDDSNASHRPWSKGTRQSIAVDAIVRVQPFKAMAARSWANESGTLLCLTRRRLKRRAVNRCVSGASSTAAQCAPRRSVEPTATPLRRAGTRVSGVPPLSTPSSGMFERRKKGLHFTLTS